MDEELVEFEFDDFFDVNNDSCPVESDYVKRQVDRIPKYGDDSRWRIADYLDLFGDDLKRDGTLTPEQREAVDNFVEILGNK